MPTRAQLHVNAPLSALSVAYEVDGYIADAVAPRFRVAKESDIYYIFDEANLTIPDTARARGTESRGIEWGTSTAQYLTSPYALHDNVFQEDIDNADDPISPRADTTEIVTTLINLDREKRVQSLVMTAATYAAANKVTLDGTSGLELWTTAAANVRSQIKNAKSAVKNASIKSPNKLIMGFNDALALDITDQVVNSKLQLSGNMEALRSGLPPQLFGLDVVVGEAYYNSAAKGQTATLTPVWNDQALVAYIEPTPRRKSRTLSMTFEYRGRITREMDEPLKKSIRIEVEEQGLDEKIIDAGCGYLISNTLA